MITIILYCIVTYLIVYGMEIKKEEYKYPKLMILLAPLTVPLTIGLIISETYKKL